MSLPWMKATCQQQSSRRRRSEFRAGKGLLARCARLLRCSAGWVGRASSSCGPGRPCCQACCQPITLHNPGACRQEVVRQLHRSLDNLQQQGGEDPLRQTLVDAQQAAQEAGPAAVAAARQGRTIQWEEDTPGAVRAAGQPA